MLRKESSRLFLVKTIKLLVVLFTLAATGWFIGTLPFSASLPFLDNRLAVGAFLNAVVALLMLGAAFAYAAEAAAPVDALLEFIPGAGRLFGNLVKIGAFLFAYSAFQPAVLPFLAGYEWAYQSCFLGLILFFLVRAGLIAYGASESIGQAIMGALNPYRQEAEDGAAQAPAVRREQPPN